MKKKKFKYVIFISAMLSLFFIVGCKRKTEDTAHKVITKTQTTSYYTCPMHHQIKEDHAGKCPICQMDLVEVHANVQASSDTLHLTEAQITLANIQSENLHDLHLLASNTVTGKINFDQQKVSIVSAFVPGRVEHLYHRTTGEFVGKGEHLFDIYSEELNSAQQEYLLALTQEKELIAIQGNHDNISNITRTAKEKLLLWGMSENSIEQLATTKKISSLTPYYTPKAGYITDVNVQEGGYVAIGAPIIKVADMSTLWAEFQVYTYLLSDIRVGSTFKINIPDMSGTTISGKVDMINPQVEPSSRITLVRISIPNPKGALKPGMQVNAELIKHNNSGTFVPTNAVLRDGKMAMVWVQTDDQSFVNKMVQTGIETKNSIQILSGLETDDRLVINGAYLLQSERTLEHGHSDGMAGMVM